MSKNKVPKSFSLNVTNQNDKKILDHIEGIENFSGYIKKLILEDIERRNRPLQTVQPTKKGGIKIVVGR
jgi:hypothetical protein